MIVADTNLISYLLLPSIHTNNAVAVRRKAPRWNVPLLWRSEFRNVLATQMRLRRLTLSEALRVMSEAERMLANSEHLVTSERVLELADASGCSAYDCEFVVLAEALSEPLVTNDKPLLRAFPDIAVAMDAYAERG